MAVFRSVLIGKARKHIGDIVLKRRNGENVASSMPLEVKKSDTLLQQAQREKFAAAIAFLKELNQLIADTTQVVKKGATKFNRIMQYTVTKALKYAGSAWIIDPAKVMFAMGALANDCSPAATNTTAQTIVYSWVDNSSNGAGDKDDTFNHLCYNTTTGQRIYEQKSAKRQDTTYSFVAPASWSGNDVAVYMSFTAAKGPKRSNSIYLATLTLH